MELESTSFGSYLRRLRAQLGLTIGALAKSAKVSPSYISQLETGQRGVPSMEIIRKLAEPLVVDHFLLGIKAGHINGDDWIEWSLNSLSDQYSPGLIHADHKPFITQLLKSLELKEPDKLYAQNICDLILKLDGEIRFDALLDIYSYCIKRFGRDPLVRFTITARGEHIGFENLLNQNIPIHYNGRLLTPVDRKRILDMMALLFPNSD